MENQPGQIISSGLRFKLFQAKPAPEAGGERAKLEAGRVNFKNHVFLHGITGQINKEKSIIRLARAVCWKKSN